MEMGHKHTYKDCMQHYLNVSSYKHDVEDL
jgi:hypothetical protein